ncbi:hypothetical protein EcWSU1_03598 [Enterobacter ludwigii]|uniref:Uncharacterized protein n=1 Tax=Enterobacter ludwigii TaxID=299767 RepID=G8LCL0_9ENTR|nr:hypothetical protein EcWSU1_03598 [Enterobacter ludwigii]
MESQRFAGKRVRQAQFTGMQHQAVAAKMFGSTAVLAQIAVLAVTDNRMTQMFQVTAELVFAPGFGQQLNQTVAGGRKLAGCHRHFRGRHAAVIRHGRLRTFVIAGKFIGNLVQLFHQRIIERSALRQPATNDRVVAFLDLVLFKLLRQQAARFAGKSHQQHTGGWPVETMSRKDVLTNLVAHGLHHHHFFIAVQPASVHQPARRFVYRDQPLILIEDLKRHASSPANTASSFSSSISMTSRAGWVASSAIS